MDPGEMEKYLKERYGPRIRGTRNEYDDNDQVPDEIAQQSLLPDVKSPNLWPVKCRMGEEKQTALLLMRKYLALENSEKVRDRQGGERGQTRTMFVFLGHSNQKRDRQRR